MPIYAFFIIGLLSSLSICGADFFSNPDAQMVKNFFERQGDVKLLEHLEYKHDPEHLVFFATHAQLDPKLYGPGICQKTRLFVAEMQSKIATNLAHINVEHKNELNQAFYNTSKHARYICNTCCALQLKVLANKELGTLWAKITFFTFTPWTEVNAQIFYDKCCTDFYKNKSVDELQTLFEATK